MMAIDAAWSVLKGTRQTTLGEFHPDFSSLYGPVKWYHGTPNQNIDSFRRHGISIKPPEGKSGKGWRYDDGDNIIPISITPNKEQAEIYANYYTDYPTNPREGTVWGIRGDPEGINPKWKDDMFGEHPVVEQDIPPERIVPVHHRSFNPFPQTGQLGDE